MVFSDKPLSPAEQKIQNNALYKAIKDVMAGILGREPTEAEMIGGEDISVHKRRPDRYGGRGEPLRLRGRAVPWQIGIVPKACELAALVGVEDAQPAILGQSFLQSRHAEIGFLSVPLWLTPHPPKKQICSPAQFCRNLTS